LLFGGALAFEEERDRGVGDAIRQRLDARTAMRLLCSAGIRFDTGLAWSRYSTITRESNTLTPPSSTRTGTLPSGL